MLERLPHTASADLEATTLDHALEASSQRASQPRYRRVLLKLSGEALAGASGLGIDPATINSISDQVREVVEHGAQVAIVVGGGNIWRGIAASAQGMDRATADYMGMLATVLNALALQDAL